tara:strand:+ start:1077 stop:1217 length:141 start_codon:yes stop_codon:yes gene_type:complete
MWTPFRPRRTQVLLSDVDIVVTSNPFLALYASTPPFQVVIPLPVGT